MTNPSPTSPCTGICTLDESNAFCLGCKRSLEEIANWSRYSEHQRRTIMAGLHAALPLKQD